MPTAAKFSRRPSRQREALRALLESVSGRDSGGLTAEVERQYPQFAPLNPEERVVAVYACLGYDARQTGQALGQTAAAVQRLLKSGIRKLGVSGKAELRLMTQ